MLLPGGGHIPQSRLTDQLSLRSSGLYEESLLQYWDHVSKRNKFVEPIHRPGYTVNYYVSDWILNLCRKPITQIFGYANALFKKNFDSDLWDGLYEWNFEKAFIISEEEQHALVSPEQRRYGSKDLRNSYCASLTRTLPQGSVLMESIRRETLI